MSNYEIEHIERVRKIAPECMVLLKSDGSFPVDQAGKIALYGCGARRTLKGGRGSADVNVKSYTTVEQGLENAGFTITTEYWMESYEDAWNVARVDFRTWLKEKIVKEGMDMLMENFSIVMPEPEYEIPMTGEGNTAIYVLSRLCGEGVDRQNVPGDLLLTKTEIRDILQLQKQYQKFMLVLNTGCIVDLSPVAEQVNNILLLSQVGMTIGDSLADVLLGKAYPSGKLAATWAAEKDYCNIGEFGNRNDTRYKEGIYVGYRYFDSIGRTPLFPFGYGLGYTQFIVTPKTVSLCGTEISICVAIKNNGDFKGKEVVQLYVSVPEGKLDQPWQTLAAFAKSKELAPGEETEITLRCPMESLASSDTKNHVKFLEKGQYILRVGNSSRKTVIAGIVALDGTVITEQIHSIGGETDFEDWKPETALKEQAVQCFAELSGNKEASKEISVLKLSAADFTLATQDIPKALVPDPEALAIVESLSEEELVYLCTGDFIGEGSKNVIGDAAITVVGAAGETTGRLKEKGICNLVMADGPSGLRLSREYGVDEKGAFPMKPKENLMEIENKLELLTEEMLKILLAVFPSVQEEERKGKVHEQNCTAIPIATALAQSWNLEVAEECANIVAEEMAHFGIHIWLAPALNIQRNPLCGRTFEYYSEDPLISGKMAAAMTREIQKQSGCCVTIKHFACNNQEANRFKTNSVVNERTLRDLYVRGFEIAVKEAQPHALMSSYNLLNGVHTSERYDLLETLLRKEWGYQGMVMSDFMTGEKSYPDENNKYRKFASAESVKAGNDLMMPGGKAHYENILRALKGEEEDCKLTRKEVETCAARNVMFAWKLRRR